MKKIIIPLIAGAMLVTAALPYTSEARRWGGGHGNRMVANNQYQKGLRLRDGSCLNANKNQAGPGLRKGKGYGPGNGMGYFGNGPKDGTGYGAPSKR